MSLASELKSFLLRGNVIDLAVGVVIGAAFSKIVDAVVTGILNPIIGIICGGIDFNEFKIGVYGDSKLLVGTVITAIINFVLVGTFLFMVIKAFNKMKAKEPEKPKETPEEIKLLTEIRDSLRK